MPIAPHFRPETSALILIDYQVGTMQLIKKMPDSALRNAVNLAKAATFAIGEEVSWRRMERGCVAHSDQYHEGRTHQRLEHT